MSGENIKPNRVVLVIEDEVPLQNAISAKLEKSNFSVITARSVDQAMNHLEDVESIDVIWLDHYLLGKESGLDFLVKIKGEDSKWKEIPIFVVSNTASEDKVRSYLSLGANKYYTKADYRLDAIIADMNKVLDGGGDSAQVD